MCNICAWRVQRHLGSWCACASVSHDSATRENVSYLAFQVSGWNLNFDFSHSAPWPFQIPPTHPQRPLSPHRGPCLGLPWASPETQNLFSLENFCC